MFASAKIGGLALVSALALIVLSASDQRCQHHEGNGDSQSNPRLVVNTPTATSLCVFAVGIASRIFLDWLVIRNTVYRFAPFPPRFVFAAREACC